MDVTELVVVAFLVFFLLLGPDKLKDIARALGEAQREYRKASSQIFNPPPPTQTEEELLRDTAKKLGIHTEGKTKEQLAEEIVRKAGEIGKQLPPKEKEVKPEAAK
jgi:sec-independent protein translocase protein TatA